MSLMACQNAVADTIIGNLYTWLGGHMEASGLWGLRVGFIPPLRSQRADLVSLSSERWLK